MTNFYLQLFIPSDSRILAQGIELLSDWNIVQRIRGLNFFLVQRIRGLNGLIVQLNSNELVFATIIELALEHYFLSSQGFSTSLSSCLK